MEQPNSKSPESPLAHLALTDDQYALFQNAANLLMSAGLKNPPATYGEALTMIVNQFLAEYGEKLTKKVSPEFLAGQTLKPYLTQDKMGIDWEKLKIENPELYTKMTKK